MNVKWFLLIGTWIRFSQVEGPFSLALQIINQAHFKYDVPCFVALALIEQET